MVGEKTEAPIPRRVFEDRTGRRLQRVTVISALVFLVIMGFAAEFIFRVYTLKPPLLTTSVFQEQSGKTTSIAPGSDVISVVMKESAYTDCGQGLLDFRKEPTGIAGYVPYNDPTALAGLRAHCNDLDAVYYQAFSFGALDGLIRALDVSGASFPLPEFNSGFGSRNRPAAFPVIAPEIGTSVENLEQIFGQSTSGDIFHEQLEALDLTGVDGGFCIDLSAYPDMRAEALLPVFEALNRWLDIMGLRSCLIGSIDANFWDSEELVGLVNQTVLLGFQATNIPSTPVAMQSWFDGVATLAQEKISPEKLSFALGSFATVWKSGRRNPERIPFSEAMLRAHVFNGAASYSAESGNTHIRYLDDDRRLNQVWVLDAVSFHNQRTALGNGSQTTIWPLGYEDPAIWTLVDADASTAEYKNAIAAEIDLSDHVAVEGTGPFSTLIARSVTGHRQVISSLENERIVAQTYSQLPSPQRIQLFGDSADLDISIAFNGLGSKGETEILLDLLKEYSISATFFLSTRDLLLSDALVQNLVSEGHTIGTATLPRESQSRISGFANSVQNNLNQQLLRDKFGHQALLVQNPSRYGQFPGDRAVLDQLQDLQTSGYFPVFSNFTAPFGEFDSLEFVSRVRKAAFTTRAKVLNFDFSRQNDDTLNQILPEILQKLVSDGFTFATLPEFAGLQVEQVLPESDTVPAGRDRAIYWFMTITWISVKNFIFLLALVVALRLPVYLILAFLRQEKFPIDNQYCPPVTVIVPAYNEEQIINKTLKSILASNYSDLKIILVDDGSTDHTADIIVEMMKADNRITLIRQENHGKWHAENSALKLVETPIFAVVDADTMLDKDAIRYLVQPFRDDSVGAVAGTVEIGNRENIITACQAVEYKISLYVMHRAQEVFNGILVVPGALGAWRTEAVIEGGFISGDTMTEDADLTVAIHRTGYKVMYAPEAKSYTEAPNSVASLVKQRLRWSLGMLQVSWKHRRSIIEGYAVGFISIIDEMWFRIVSNLVYPLVDIILIVAAISWGYSAATEGFVAVSDFSVKVIVIFALLSFLDTVNLLAAFWFQKKFEWRLLLLVPFTRFGYRQLLYITSIHAHFQALSGRLGVWHSPARTDTALIRK